ncbi:host RecBCD nuclease inhibitor [Rhizobium phage RL2RES]|uniref:Uncharacterized protein n=1 Tax=Rhizobium phage RL2RES TaxID=103371 RepID=A0A6B9J3T6_9CAUD|nr:host RecBCD nuclease inhibitor [Rhizobium phage RL2RES]QGZ14302.1 hypothetical protein RL2RES_158 [Rhizobium phage RL2RES]
MAEAGTLTLKEPDESLVKFEGMVFEGSFSGDVTAIGHVTLPFEDYTRLLKRDALLTALEWRGVNTWIGYEEAKKRADDYS